LKPIVVCAFSPFTGGGDPHRQQKSEERRKPLQTPLVSQVFLRRRVNPCVASGGDAGRRSAAAVQATQSLYGVVPVVRS